MSNPYNVTKEQLGIPNVVQCAEKKTKNNSKKFCGCGVQISWRYRNCYQCRKQRTQKLVKKYSSVLDETSLSVAKLLLFRLKNTRACKKQLESLFNCSCCLTNLDDMVNKNPDIHSFDDAVNVLRKIQEQKHSKIQKYECFDENNEIQAMSPPDDGVTSADKEV